MVSGGCLLANRCPGCIGIHYKSVDVANPLYEDDEPNHSEVI